MASSGGYGGLRHRTRGDASPQGRPRVYFCCHPDDFGAYFEPVCREVLDVQTNAAVWYYDPAEGVPDGPELLDDLRRMQLFVIPVTSRFVYLESRARDVELPLAVEAHVPVLPIMQEDIPSRDFSKACGSLQTLSRYASMSDPTAIPYEDKLRGFLRSVLVGDELAERVRAAFDAYVFLSYRKKDRVQAQRVMSLIHEEPLCRDIAIWYDEFLVPGEDFRDAIDDALRRCSVFSLVVTPHLLEPGNFVMREEYPTARDSGKPVVPVEAVETDHGELADAYCGIGDTVPAGDRDGLSSRLLDSLRDVALRENDQDPQHNFFIGLAYLTGIDVEVDHDRALALITSAAEAGLPEAYERLVAMYNAGEGVERDYHKAIEWQERYVGMLSRTAEVEPSWGNQKQLVVALIGLGDMRIETGNPTGALDAYEGALEMNRALAEELGTVESRRILSVSLGRVGDARMGLGDPTGALGAYGGAIEIAEVLAEELGTVESRRDLSVSLGRVGNARMGLGDPAGALGAYERSLELSKALAEELGTPESRRDLSVSLIHVGDARMGPGDPEMWLGGHAMRLADPAGALGAYERSLELSKALAEELGTVESRRDLSVSLGRVGNARMGLGDPTGALDVYKEALEMDKALAEELGTVQSQRDLSVSLCHVGDARMGLGDPTGALDVYKKALEMDRALAEELGTVESRRGLLVSECKVHNARLAFVKMQVDTLLCREVTD